MPRASRRRLVAAAFLAYLAVVAFGVFGPAPGDQIEQAGDGVRRVAGEIAAPAVRRRSGDGMSQRREAPLLGRLTNEAVANAAMFVPWGVLFPVVVRRWRWWTIPAGAALSGTIELIQLLLSWRSPSLIDVGWNITGAVAGFVLWLTAWVGWRRRLKP